MSKLSFDLQTGCGLHPSVVRGRNDLAQMIGQVAHTGFPIERVAAVPFDHNSTVHKMSLYRSVHRTSRRQVRSIPHPAFP